MATLDRIAFIFPKMLNVVCFSHTLDNVGNHLVIPTLLEFGDVWIRLFRHSYKAKLLWKDLTEQRPRSYSETRWWSKWEVYRSEYRLILSRRSVWIRLFRHSYKATLLWKDLTGQRPRSYSETRWWSKWEVYRSEYRLILSRRATSILRVHFLRACFCLRHAALQTM